VKAHDAQMPSTALLAGKEVAVTHTGVFGMLDEVAEKNRPARGGRQENRRYACSRGDSGRGGFEETARESSGHITLIDFWATCVRIVPIEFSDLQDTVPQCTSAS